MFSSEDTARRGICAMSTSLLMTQVTGAIFPLNSASMRAHDGYVILILCNPSRRCSFMGLRLLSLSRSKQSIRFAFTKFLHTEPNAYTSMHESSRERLHPSRPPPPEEPAWVAKWEETALLMKDSTWTQADVMKFCGNTWYWIGIGLQSERHGLTSNY